VASRSDDDRARLEAEFTRAMLDICDRFNREIAYNPTVFRRMVTDHGGVVAARGLLTGRQAQSGLERLWQHGRLGESVEAHVLLPQFSSLFSDRERRSARRRLEDHGFDVDAFLERVGKDRPHDGLSD
jgi:hypothetical protein